MGEPSLWSADDQRSRLDELTAGTADPAKDLPLRRDVRLLGILLGHVLVEQVGESLLDVVEELRHLLIRHREQAHPQDCDAGFQRSAARPGAGDYRWAHVEDAYRVTKAFAIYFELTNLAETNHRKRRRRAAKLHQEQAALAGSFRGTFAAHASGRDRRRAGPRGICAK